MKKISFLLIFSLLFYFGNSFIYAQNSLPNRIIVKFKTDQKIGSSLQAENKLLRAIKIVKAENLFPDTKSSNLKRIYSLQYTGNLDPQKLSVILEREKSVVWAEPDYYGKLAGFTPNDPRYSEQWYLNNVRMENAWDLQFGASGVLVAVIDNGITLNHPELQNAIWTNPDETANGIDDDGDGFIDDIHGWDFGENDNDVSHDAAFYHGTQVAGIIAAETNNNLGIASIAFGAKILPLKVTEADAPGEVIMSEGYQAIVFAADKGADVINCSWGNYQYSHLGEEAVDYAVAHGATVVAAAGNDGADEIFYPARFSKALSVGAISSDNTIWTHSNRGYYLDMLAPGDSILSLSGAPEYYESASGTSLASPVVAGIAALVKAHFSSYNAEQIREQVRVTAQSIYQQNPGMEYLLGTGSADALTALSSNATKSVRATNFTFSDSNDNVAQPGDTIHLKVDFRNYLSSLTNLTVTLTTADNNISILNSTFNAGAISASTDFSNENNEFVFVVGNSVPENHTAHFLLLYNDVTYNDFQWTSLTVNPTFLDMNLNKITLTIAPDGNLGFTDYPYNNKGDGLFYDNDNLKRFFESGFMYGVSSSEVMDNLHDTMYGAQSGDFTQLVPLTINIPGADADQQGHLVFDDSGAGASRIGIRTDLHSYEYSAAESENYVILRYVLHNTTSSVVDNLYAGLFFDWDLDEDDYADDIVGYDAADNFGYAYDSGFNTISTYQGAALISDENYNFYAITNNGSDGGINLDPFTKGDKWTALSSGLTKTAAGPNDISFVVSGGPYTLGAGEYLNVAFAVAIADSLNELSDAFADARSKYAGLPLAVNDNTGTVPEKFKLMQNYPNPFNPTTTINYVIAIPTSRDAFGGKQSHELSVRLTVYDALGRKVATLVNKKQAPGNYSVQFDASKLSSGIYFYTLRAGEFTATKKMILMK